MVDVPAVTMTTARSLRSVSVWERPFIVAHLCSHPAASGSATHVSRVYHLLTNTDLERPE